MQSLQGELKKIKLHLLVILFNFDRVKLGEITKYHL